MQKNKTTETKKSVAAFVRTVTDPQRQKDCHTLIEIMKAESGFDPRMWGPAIIGFGSYHYKYDSGREGDAPLVGFSPRKSEFALYLANYPGKETLLKNFGKHKTAKSCVYIKRVSDIDVEVLKKLVAGAIPFIRSMYS